MVSVQRGPKSPLYLILIEIIFLKPLGLWRAFDSFAPPVWISTVSAQPARLLTPPTSSNSSFCRSRKDAASVPVSLPLSECVAEDSAQCLDASPYPKCLHFIPSFFSMGETGQFARQVQYTARKSRRPKLVAKCTLTVAKRAQMTRQQRPL